VEPRNDEKAEGDSLRVLEANKKSIGKGEMLETLPGSEGVACMERSV